VAGIHKLNENMIVLLYMYIPMVMVVNLCPDRVLKFIHLRSTNSFSFFLVNYPLFCHVFMFNLTMFVFHSLYFLRYFFPCFCVVFKETEKEAV
jgi:hypothetical protein